MPEAFSNVSAESLGGYMKAQFHYWSEDEIACNFRKMLTLEQYKSPEMNALYQKVLVSGPMDYIENLFREMSKKQEKQLPSPHVLAVEFYSPFFLLLSMSDGVECTETKEEIAKNYECYIDESYPTKERNWQRYLESFNFKRQFHQITLLLAILYW